jgi:hypothetical protein
MIRIERLPFIFLAMVSLIVAMLAGLQRIGWSFNFGHVSSNHGAIMVGGFLGTLISLEKIITLKRKVLFIIPACSGISVILFFAQAQSLSLILLTIASVGLSLVFVTYWLKERSLVYALMFVGAGCWLVGNILLIQSGFYPMSLPWWMAFALLIISSERLELMKFLPVSKNEKVVFIVALGTFVVSCIISFHGVGKLIAAASLVGTGVWLMRYDIAAFNARKTGLTRYVGVALLTGYFSLVLSGIFIGTLTEKPLGYDALVHCFFIGFVFSMILAHGPIILPGVLGISVKPYHHILYVWLGFLHVSWAARTFADIALNMPIRKYAGLMTAIAVLGYFVSLGTLSIRSHRAKAV